MEYKDYYKVLGVDKSSSQNDIKSAYRKLAKKYHPDLNPNDDKSQEKFKEINEAYEVLGDDDKKKKYDTFGSSYDFSGGQDFNPSQYGYSYTSTGDGNFSDFFNTFFGGSTGSRTSKGFNINDLFGGGGRTSGFGRGRGEPQRQSYESELSITLEEGFSGATKEITLNFGGENKEMSINIPKGIFPGKKLKVKGEKWGINGDIIFKINFVKDDKTSIEGLDITARVDLLPWEAALGAKIVVNTLDGKIKVNIPKGIVGGKKIRIPSRGYIDMNGSRGDLYIESNIVNPTILTDEEIKLYEELSKISTYKPRNNNE